MSDIPFESLASLVQKLARPPSSTSEPKKHVSPDRIFASWLAHHPQPLNSGTGKHIFRLLFPHEGARRRYGLKETLLARDLSRALGVPRKELDKWDRVSADGDTGGEGCLGLAVMAAVQDRSFIERPATITLAEVDALLDQLAAHSPFSALSQAPSQPKPQSVILDKLYRDAGLSPYALALLTQIILRDLRPLLNPLPRLPVRNPTTMLRLKSNAGPAQLELSTALRMWGQEAWELFRGGKGDLDWCCDVVERGVGVLDRTGPVLGVNVQIPKCRKGRSVEDALSEFTGTHYADAARTVWAETKYDGYRLQIHVDIRDHIPIITIFSKSKRNTTFDRINTHSIILSALGLTIPGDLPLHPALSKRIWTISPVERRIQSSVILEAEVVPYNEGQREGSRGPGIEEFWRLDAAGVTVLPGAAPLQADRLVKKNDRHLCLAFFDILHLDGESLLSQPYSKRRTLLEAVTRTIPGFAFPVERIPIHLHLGRQAAIQALRHAFNLSAVNREEGLVLKSSSSPYPGHTSLSGSYGHRWVKLKRDYVPNLGDCIDLVIIGAGWDMDRARELRVDTSVITTFYVGVLVNQDRVKARAEAPHFEILFRVSYGADRDMLEVWNANVRLGRWGSRPYDRDDPFKRRLLGLSWTYRIPKSMPAPSLLFNQPMCCEVMGAGFQKVPWCDLYELRWPRLQKIYEPRERPWTEALTGPDLLRTAHLALGYSTSSSPNQLVSSPENDSVRALWRNASKSAIDIAESLPPTSPRKSGRAGGIGHSAGMQRNQSAPDLAELQAITKFSPPTPGHSGQDRASGSDERAGPRIPLTPATGMRLQGAINRDTQKDDEMDMEEDDEGPLVLRTPPRSSSGKDRRLRSPLFSLSPKKRTPPISFGSHNHRPDMVDRVVASEELADPYDTSVELGRCVAVPVVEPTWSPPRCTSPIVREVDTVRKEESKAKRRKVGKPLSLRSRILLAIRQ